jgi:hypothetical protein
VNGDGLKRLIQEKYGRLTVFYELAPEHLGESTQTLKRFIGSGKPSRKELTRELLQTTTREVIEALILKVEELQQQVDNLVNTINLDYRWDNERERWK